ncbi:MAG: TetR/AcrR family transcriptional regulator [Ignavibacteriales bacterium]|nr:TetR/AcrR family transcriptional regulator [Ignavibacteriales bacterium]
MKTKTQKTQSGKVQLLEVAQRLMLAKGYTATSVDEICQQADLSKGSFFHYFESKEELGKAALDGFYFRQKEGMLQAEFRKEADPLKRVESLIDFLIQAFKNPDIPKSCLIGNFSQELSETHPEIRKLCADHFADWAESVKSDLDEAKTKYKPHTPLDTQSIADYLIAVIEGTLILYKAKKDIKIFEKNLGHLKLYVQSIF